MNAPPRGTLPRLAITVGEPAGIGPELVVKLAQRQDLDATLVAIGDPDQLRETARALALPLALRDDDDSDAPGLRVVPIPLRAPAVPGRVDPRNAAQVLAVLAQAADGAASGRYDAIVTAPVHKAVLNDAGHRFTGHTEFFAERARAEVAMLLVAGELRVALATTHLPLRDVPAAIDTATVERIARILDRGLRERFALASPRIAVLGLNPHAGEGGHLGREETEVLAPVVERLRAEGLDLQGPLSADTAFTPARRAGFDAYLAMYHDQGLPVLKALGFGDGVNVTLGLPYVRTSVDHGTALELAGRGVADASSLVAAAKLAASMARAR